MLKKRPTPSPPSRKPTRGEKADQTRRDLFAAAAVVVGKVGYEAASIAAITGEAGVANGTFYNYFDSRQELFDQLLPSVGEDLLRHITAAVEPETGGLARERDRFRAYFDYCEKNPGFLRILNEAEVFAPEAFRGHIERFAEGYVRALKRSRKRGEIANFDEGELRTVAYLLMGARSYLSAMQASGGPRVKVAALERTYLKMLENGLFRSSATER
jgi:AcrR family transcriptional regulator